MDTNESDQENINQNCNEKRNDETRFLVEETKKLEDLDDVLLESVGKFGLFQAWLLLLLFFCQATFAPAIYGSVFTDFTPKHHCAQDELEAFNLTKWEDEEQRCSLVQEGNISECSKWTFDESVIVETVSANFDIVCDKAFLKTLSGTLRMSGLLIGSFSLDGCRMELEEFLVSHLRDLFSSSVNSLLDSQPTTSCSPSSMCSWQLVVWGRI
eukprot:TRINITY_DN7934_c0_g1_i2.p1 TRINITY_DN7934_c0_g1~~TRINITY_DN7934_c0_g1_i2.p1  ORF type:complete len:212 (+),score=54.76 TRINITY_DN7934_c0_g1_i2:85-720(+)